MASKATVNSRESGRIKDANQKRVLDEATRRRRARKALEALEQDNYHDDPHADLGEFSSFMYSLLDTILILLTYPIGKYYSQVTTEYILYKYNIIHHLK